MKKKLIAIVASLAMVATMVPATAFAGVAGTDVTGPYDGVEQATAVTVPNALGTISLKVAEGNSEYEQPNWLGAASANQNKPAYQDATKLGTNTSWIYNETVTGDYKNGTLTLKGVVPYVDKSFEPSYVANGQTHCIYDPAERAGHYVGLYMKAVDPDVSDVIGWAFSWASNEKNTEADQTISEGTIHKLVTHDSADGSAYAANNNEKMFVKLSESGTITYTVYYLTKPGINTFGKYSWKYKSDPTAKVFETLFGDPKFTGDDKQATTGTGSEERNVTLSEVVKAAKSVNGIAATETIKVDTSSLTKLTEKETKAINEFVDAVNGIKAGTVTASDKVDRRYRTLTGVATDYYNDLDATAKAAVETIVESKTVPTENAVKKAYKEWEMAKDNVASFDEIDAVAKLVAELPDSSTFDLKDEAAVKQVNKAKDAVEELTDGARGVLRDINEGYLTKKQIENYDALVKKVGDTAIKTAVDMINGLKRPTKFTDQASVDAISAPLVAADKAYRNLSKTDRTKVDAETDPTLAKYKEDYEKLLLEYVDSIWEKAVKIDVDQPLSEESVTLITELKTYVEGNYFLDTDEMTDFRPATYEALIAALGNEQPTPDISLKDAAIAAIEDQTYTGAAIEPAVTVTDKDGAAIPAEGYTVSYKDNTNVGTATVTVTNKKDEADVISATFTIKAATLTDAMVKNIGNVTYTGKAIKPTVSAATAGVTFDVAYKNNTAVGKATATITGTGNYTGTITKNFIVKPAKEAISSLKAGKKSLTVAYKAQTGAKYRIVYSPAKGQAKAVNTTATKKTIKSLKAGKTYKVKVRAYKTIDGTTYNGTYSTVKKVKVK